MTSLTERGGVRHSVTLGHKGLTQGGEEVKISVTSFMKATKTCKKIAK